MCAVRARPNGKQGYAGARWPKCVGPEGDPAPTFLECFLIWQQPHPIYYSELCYRANPQRTTLAKRDGVYVAGETAADTFTKPDLNTSHPCMLAPLGMVDGSAVDRAAMSRTLRRVMQGWDWGNTWGWDYPVIAMTAARLGESDTALQALLKPESKNTYLPNGHNFRISETLPIYLPGNGGLLYAAMMAGGWDGAPKRHAPGFRDDGSWMVRWEGLAPAP